MRRENFTVGLALVLIVRLEMGDAIGEGLQARTATRDSAATAAPVILEVIATDKRAHGPAEGLTQDDFELLEGRSVAQVTSKWESICCQVPTVWRRRKSWMRC